MHAREDCGGRSVRECACVKAGAELPISPAEFRQICAQYYPGLPLRLLLSDPRGRIFIASGECGCSPEGLEEKRVWCISQSLRWGEPVICDHVPGRLIWAVPLMRNALLTGGIIVCADEDALFPENGSGLLDLTGACARLLEIVVERNHTNAALLAQVRQQHLLERRKAEAIHESKDCGGGGGFMQAYLEEEPVLLRAVRAGRREEAVAIINRLLVFIYGYAGSNQSLIKSLLLELLSAMNRAAVEAGARPEEVFSRNFSLLGRLGEISGDEALSGWLREALEGIISSLQRPFSDEKGLLLRRIHELLGRRCGEQLSREEAADELGMSPGALSRFLKEQAGCGFSQMLARLRVGAASRLLAGTSRPLLQIALDCGFTDQSYFTRIFHQQTGMTPRDYRLRYGAAGNSSASR